MHQEISLSLVENVSFSQIDLTTCLSLVNGWLGHRFFNWSFVTTVSHDCWHCWRNTKVSLVQSSSYCSIRTSNFGRRGRDWSFIVSVWKSRESWWYLSALFGWLVVTDNSTTCSSFNCIRWNSSSFELFHSSFEVQIFGVFLNIFLSYKRSFRSLRWFSSFS